MSVRASSRSEEHTSELQSQSNLVCRLLLEKKKKDHVRITGKYKQEIDHFVFTPRFFPETQRRLQISFGRAREYRLEGHAFFFFNDTATTEIYTLSLHDALPI